MSARSISDLQLELLALGALPEAEKRALRDALAQDSGAQARYEALAASNAALLREFPVDKVSAEVARRVRVADAVQDAAPRRLLWARIFASPLIWATVLVCAIATFVVLAPQDKYPAGVRVKGGPHLVVHRVFADSAEQLAEGDVAREGDRIQLSVAGAELRYVVVLSVDGNGLVTLHFPRPGDKRMLGADVEPTSLPTSYELDDAPEFERFFLFTAQDPLDLDDLLERVRAAGSDPNTLGSDAFDELAEGVTQSSFLLRKVR